jgi:Putative Flp pilus-assembly TadE/G-like
MHPASRCPEQIQPRLQPIPKIRITLPGAATSRIPCRSSPSKRRKQLRFPHKIVSKIADFVRRTSPMPHFRQKSWQYGRREILSLPGRLVNWERVTGMRIVSPLRIALPRRDVRGFIDQDDGQISVFVIILFFLMVIFGGMSVDMMRHENARTGLQQTLDRAILAAASMKQTRDPDVVVKDYFQKAGMIDQLGKVTYNKALDSRDVTAAASVPVQTFFMRLLDVNTLNAGAAAKAEEGVSNIEISLVLDISGSMRFGDQIGKLRVAAKSFFSQILTAEAKETTSINVIPYAGQVNVGPLLFTKLGGVRVHANSSCLEVPASSYDDAGKVPSGLAQVPHFMKWAIDTVTMDWGWCPKDNSAIIVAQNDKAKLDTFIDNIRLHDGTGTMTGMKYGLMLLNPSMRSIFADLATAKVISDDFKDRPKAWTTSVGSDVQKYLIVMTDGAITEQARPKYTGIRDTDTDTKDNENVNGNPDPDTVDGVDHDLLNAQMELDNQPSGFRATSIAAATNVTSFGKQCNLAKTNGVIVFSIAFNVTDSAARTQMQNCASSTSYYYNVPSSDDGTAIKNAFSSIARTIKQLRLTQ